MTWEKRFAYRAEAFGGRWWPERVAFVRGEEVWVDMEWPNGLCLGLRVAPRDGVLFDTEAECRDWCEARKAGKTS